MHKLLAWLRRDEGDQPPMGDADAEQVVDELEDTPLADGYESNSKGTES